MIQAIKLKEFFFMFLLYIILFDVDFTKFSRKCAIFENAIVEKL